MGRKMAFTLIELLVVISIIAVLLGILFPSLRKARESSRAVVCLSNLKQWGVGLGVYWAENNDKFFKDYYDNADNPTQEQRAARRWHNALWPYVKTTKIFLCPTATKPQYTTTNTTGITNTDMTFATWPISDQWSIPETKGLNGSYGLNSWVTNRAYSPGNPTYNWNWRTAGGQGFSPSAIPILGDSWWNRSECKEGDVPPAYRGENKGSSNCMSRFCLDRHNENINMLFMDLTVRKVGLKELWTLKWHRQFNTRGPWTLADPDSSARWKMAAPWMAQMREY